MYYRSSSLSIRKPRNSEGFTIVELLVVIVVIAILAAVSILAYIGITKRAIETSVINDASNAASRLAVDKVTNNDLYPLTTAAANDGKGLQKSANTVFQYTVNNIASPPAYCLTLTNVSITNTYYVSSTNNVPTTGLCPGHVSDPPTGTDPLTPPANNSNIVITSSPTAGINMAYTGFIDVYTSATGTPSPTVSWERMVPKNSATGTWEVISGQTSPQLHYIMGLEYTENDYFYARPIYVNSSGTAVGNAIRVEIYYAGD